MLTLLGFALGVPTVAIGQVSLPTNFTSETIVQALGEPTSFAFLPDGRVLVTEQRTGRVRMVVGTHIAATDPVVTVASLNATGNERGLLAIAVDPRWPGQPYVYLYYSRIGNRMRLVRYEASGDLDNPTGENLTLANPLLLIDDIPDNASNHNGGALRFDPQGYLYLTMGEDADRCSAQDSTRLKGELLRLDIKGLPPGGGPQVLRSAITPPDNPLSTPDSNAALVYAYGFRNPFRFHIDPVTSLVYVGDVGELTFEEYDEVRAGNNMGWPFREADAVRNFGGCFEPGGVGASPYTGPIAFYDHSTGAAIISAGPYRPPVAGTEVWPTEYWGDVMFSDYYSGILRRLKNTGGSWAPAPAPGQPTGTEWGIGFVAATDYLIGPDGAWWWLDQFDATFGSFSGSLNRIRYTGPTVSVPPAPAASAAFTAAPSPFTALTDLSFTLPRPGRARLSIYDVSGREVRRLWEGAAAGPVRVTWDGADGSGRVLPAGLYLGRVEGAGIARTLRILKLR
jgi:hypothetical protein